MVLVKFGNTTELIDNMKKVILIISLYFVGAFPVLAAGCSVIGGWPGAQYGQQAQLITDSIPCYGITGTKGGPIVLQGSPSITTPNFTGGFFDVDGNIFGTHSTNYNQLTDIAGTNAIQIGNTTDPTTYYSNGVHQFRSKNTAVPFASITSSGISIFGSTSGTLILEVPAIAGSNVLKFPAGSTDFTATGGANQVLQQSTLGGAITVGAISATATAITIGTTTITSGNTNTILFQNGASPAGTIGEIATANNSVLSTNGSGVPSLSTTLPSNISATNMVLTTPTIGAATGTSLALTSFITSTNHTITSASANALAVGLNGTTNSAFSVDASTALQAAGLNIKGAATGGTVTIAAIDSGSNTNITLNAKGTGTIGIGTVSTGAVTITPPTTHSGALTYGGVTLSNSVTGTGSMVLSNTPTLTGAPILSAPSATTIIVGSSTTLPASDLSVVSANSTTLPAVSGGALFHMGGANSGSTAMYLDGFAVNPTFAFRRANTTAASPSALQSGDIVMNFVGVGYGATAYAAGARTYVRGIAAENWSDTVQGMYLSFGTTPTTTATSVEAVRIQASGGVSIGTSTDPGIGSLQINAQAFIPNALNDAGLTDATACLRASTGQVLKGSGTLGICLGTSSERYKTNIKDLDIGLSEIIAMKPKSFYLDAEHGDPSKLMYGFLAEDCAKVIPKLTGFDNLDRANTCDYLGVVPVLVKAVQELSNKLEHIEKVR